jgi:tricarballylate dehydrogenase
VAGLKRNLIIAGQGAAGLAAALSAAEETQGSIAITLIDKAPQDQAGGNTLWSPSNMRMASPDRVEPGFVQDMLSATQFRGEESYFQRLAMEAPAAVKWLQSYGVEFIQPPYYMAQGASRIQPAGGGASLIKLLTEAGRRAGIRFRYECKAQEIVTRDDEIAGLGIEQNGRNETLPANAIILACGGFQGNADMMRTHLGDGAENIRLISPGTRFNTGDGIAMALQLGADISGDWGGMHCEPIDPRSKNSAPVVLVYPYGIVVDSVGRRFFDEGEGLMHDTWERLARKIHFDVPGSIAYAIFDSRLIEIPGYQRAIRSEVAPFQAQTLQELGQIIGVDPAGLIETVATYNAACTGSAESFDPAQCDGLSAAKGLAPPKSNWAREIDLPPFLAYPLMGAIAYTFGGLATDAQARVLRKGIPIAGLFAAGEITGHFYKTAPNAVSVLRALVFGSIAGREASRALGGAGI